MNSATAKRLVIGSVLVAGALASFKNVKQGEPPNIRIAVGGMFLLVFLLVLADIEPQIAGSLALLVLVSSLVAIGPDPFKALTTATGSKPSA